MLFLMNFLVVLDGFYQYAKPLSIVLRGAFNSNIKKFQHQKVSWKYRESNPMQLGPGVSRLPLCHAAIPKFFIHFYSWHKI